MKYTTTDELEHFSFAEAYIADVQVTGGFFHMTLSNVTILPENSCNRDIREMRANDLVLKIEEPVIRSWCGRDIRSTMPTARCCGPARMR